MEGAVKSHILYRCDQKNLFEAGNKICIRGNWEDRSVKLTWNGKNLFRGQWGKYYLKADKLKKYGVILGGYRTTEWFEIDASQKYLNLTGDAFNRAVWQFRDNKGQLIAQQPEKLTKYRVVKTKRYDRTCARTAIPSEAVEARVYFAREDEKECAKLGETLQIAYGRIPECYAPFYEYSIEIELSRKTECIEIEGEQWRTVDKKNHTVKQGKLDIVWNEVDSLRIDGVSECDVQVMGDQTQNISGKEHGEYGIRWKMDSPIPFCERVGDASGLHFNYKIGEEWAGRYQNDFDAIYPWSNIRTCVVRTDEEGKRQIHYEGEDGFIRDGSAGEVMVEIPSYYTKREQKDGYEYIWITDAPKDGYELDPSFRTKDGSLSCIYIGAYLGSEKNGMVHSYSDTFVTLKRSMKKYLTMIDSSNGYCAYDFLAHLTIQRLFLVETATLDSQAVFQGICHLPYKIVNTKSDYYALESHENTNEIIVRDSSITRRLLVGDATTVLDFWRDYRNRPEFQRVVTETQPIDANRLRIRFSGPPVNVYKEQTAISALARRNGDTDCLTYHSAAGIENRYPEEGHDSFRYRGIENLWGNVWVAFGNCYVMNNRFYITYPDGTIHQPDYDLPVQNVILTSKQFGTPTEMCVKEMGYDEKEPLLMLPSKIGDGASTNTWYCDAWYNIAEKDVKYLVTYGGAWDNLGYAGIFCYRANYVMKDTIPFNGVRLMLR